MESSKCKRQLTLSRLVYWFDVKNVKCTWFFFRFWWWWELAYWFGYRIFELAWCERRRQVWEPVHLSIEWHDQLAARRQIMNPAIRSLSTFVNRVLLTRPHPGQRNCWSVYNNIGSTKPQLLSVASKWYNVEVQFLFVNTCHDNDGRYRNPLRGSVFSKHLKDKLGCW